jgi:hypothetical protein
MRRLYSFTCLAVFLCAVFASLPTMAKTPGTQPTAVQMLPPKEGQTDETCRDSSGESKGKILTWDGASALRCNNNVTLDNDGDVDISGNTGIVGNVVAGTVTTQGIPGTKAGNIIAKGAITAQGDAATGTWGDIIAKNSGGVQTSGVTRMCTLGLAGMIRYDAGKFEGCICNGTSCRWGLLFGWQDCSAITLTLSTDNPYVSPGQFYFGAGLHAQVYSVAGSNISCGTGGNPPFVVASAQCWNGTWTPVSISSVPSCQVHHSGGD